MNSLFRKVLLGILCVFVLCVVFLAIHRNRKNSQIDDQVAKIRSDGYPATARELDDWYTSPKGENAAALRAMVGERATGLHVFSSANIQDLNAITGGIASRKLAAPFGLYRAVGLMQNDQLFYLDHMGRIVETLSLPLSERTAAMAQTEGLILSVA